MRADVLVPLGFITAAFLLGLGAFLRCDKADIPEIVRGLAEWFRRSRH